MTGQGIVVADVGGTNTRLGYLAQAGDAPVQTSHFQNADFADFEGCLRQYLGQIGVQGCAQIFIAVAAPIEGDVVTLTNCNWKIDGAALRHFTGAKSIHLLNDLEALALALGHLPATSFAYVAGPRAPHDPKGRKLVIGAGTGFNAACLLQAPSQIVLPAECGHMTLPAQTADDLRLWDHLAKDRGRASVERALSGLGLCETYHWVARELGRFPDALTAQQITDRARLGADLACVKTTQIALRLLAIVAGDLALAYLPHGGIYLAGSVCRALFPMMKQAGFAEQFTAKGRQSTFMTSFPIYLMTDDFAALIGCAGLANSKIIPVAEPAE